jgi:hypothetical protein
MIEDWAYLGNLLWRENKKSYDSRYGGDNPIGTIEINDIKSHENLDPIQILKSIEYYEYQSCEHRGYYDSESHKIMEALKNKAIYALKGFEGSIWGMPEL